MTTQEFQQQLLNLSDREKVQVIQFLSRDHNFVGRGIDVMHEDR